MKLLLVALLLTACAKRTYISAQGMSGGGGNKQQNLEKCLSRFSSGLCVSMSWDKVPSEQDFGTFLFKTFRPNVADGSSVVTDLPGTMAVVLWMPSMGHGSSPVTVERLDVGTFRASKVFFTMKGNWEIRVQVKDGENVRDQAVVPFTL